jgi:WD40 repeat protein
LARSVLGTYRAIKLVYRRHFEEDSPYEREFRGIKKFEPVSRSHEGLVHVLHVGRNDAAGYFYYVMELADDANGDPTDAESESPRAGEKQATRNEHRAFDPQRYEPKTLKTVLSRRGSLALNECVELGLSLTSGLDHLHRHQLIHRDLKPSNIIFVNHHPKIADIGLVAELGSSKSFVGTEGFIPPEGPGQAQADLYSLGKVLYETSTGLDRRKFPVLPDRWTNEAGEKWLELNEVLLKACDANVARRYRSADEMHSDLEVLRGGKSVKRLRLLERRLALMTRLLVAFGLMLFLAAGAYYMVFHAQKLSKQRLAESYVAFATRAVNENDLVAALPWLARALALEQGDRRREQAHRIRLAMVSRQCPKLIRTWFRAGEQEILYAEFSPDGTRVVAGAFDGKTLVWRIDPDQVALELEGHKQPVRGATFSPDGRFIATASADGTAKIWRADDGRLTNTLTHSRGIFSVQFHPLNSELLLTACADARAQLWDWRAARLVMEFTNQHTLPIRRARFSPDGRHIVTASEDGSAQVWDVASGKPIAPPLRHGSWVYDAEFSPDGRWLVTAGFDNSAGLWEVETGRQLWTWPHEAAVRSVAFSPDGRYVAIAAWDFTTRIWDLHRKSPRPAFPPLKQNSLVHCVRFDPSGRRLLTTSATGVLTLWDLAPIHWRPPPVTDVYSGDGNRCLTVTNQALRVWDASTGKAISTPVPVTDEVHTVLLNQDGSRALVCVKALGPQSQTNLQARLWDASGKSPRPLGPVFSCGLLSSAPWIACLSGDGERLGTCTGQTGAVWQTQTGTLLRNIYGSQPIKRPVLDPTGKWLALARGANAEIWETTGTNAPRLLSHAQIHTVEHVQFSPDGGRLVTSCEDTTALPRQSQIWDVRTGHKIGAPLKHSDGVWTASFSPDGKRVVTASEDDTAQVWDSATGRRLTPPLKHKFDVFVGNFSPDGRWIVTASKDNTARVWNAETGEAVTPPLPHDNSVVGARFVAGGQAVLTIEYRGPRRRWELISDPRPLPELDRIAQLLAAHTVDPIGGAIPISHQELETLWHDLRVKYPRDFAVTPEEVLRWHERELEKNEADKQWTAALFHVDQLLKLKPDEARWLERRSRLLTPSAPP